MALNRECYKSLEYAFFHVNLLGGHTKQKFHTSITLQANPRMTLFTGSSRVADKLAVDLKGRIKLEDAGFDWKILGPDVQEVSYKES